MKLKEIKEVGSRGILFTFEFGDSVYLINAKEHLFLCDTSEDMEAMSYVKDYIMEHDLSHKTLYLFNSHSDWDHVWGNGAFHHVSIIGHVKCRERMIKRTKFDLEVHDKNPNEMKIKLPNMTFSDKLIFNDEQIEFIYAPGHTIDSTICFDLLDGVIYVGDLLENPIPTLMHYDLIQYIKTLESLKKMDANILITTHSNIVTHDLIDEHILYLKDVLSGKYLTFNSTYTPLIHAQNIKNILVLKFDERVRHESDNFNFYLYKLDLWNYILQKVNNKPKRLWDLSLISYNDLKKILEEYYEQKYNN